MKSLLTKQEEQQQDVCVLNQQNKHSNKTCVSRISGVAPAHIVEGQVRSPAGRVPETNVPYGKSLGTLLWSDYSK